MTRGGLISLCYEEVVEPCEEAGASSGDRTPRRAALWRAAQQGKGKSTFEAYARCVAWDHPTWDAVRVAEYTLWFLTRTGLIQLCAEDAPAPCLPADGSFAKTQRSAALWRLAQRGMPSVGAYERCLAWDHPTWDAARVSQEARRVYTAVQEAGVRGTVVLATRFGMIAAAYFAADLVAYGAPDISALVHHPAWADQVGLVGGPCCVPVWDDEVPF